MKTLTISLALIGAITLVICGCAVTPTMPITTMTTNDSIRGPATAESTRRWNKFLSIPGPAIYRHPDGVTYKTADNQLSSQVQDVPDSSEGRVVRSRPSQPSDTGTDSYNDLEGNLHVVSWDNDMDGNRRYEDHVTGIIEGGSYDTNH